MNNESAIKFYEKFGFEIVEQKANYYKRIEPADAFVLQKTFRKRDDQDIQEVAIQDEEDCKDKSS